MAEPAPSGALTDDSRFQDIRGADELSTSASQAGQHMTVHEANRMKKEVERNVRAIENRIRFFEREEEKIWRDLEEVKRQAATIEDGRSRTLEKKLADRSIAQAKAMAVTQNRARATVQKEQAERARNQLQKSQIAQKAAAGDLQRKQRQDILQQKRMNEAQIRLQNSEKAVAIERQKNEARRRVLQARERKLEEMRTAQEVARLQAEHEVSAVEDLLPALEAKEMVCLQRLQNSRIVTQSVLEELESSLGSRNTVTQMLARKARAPGDSLGGLEEEGLEVGAVEGRYIHREIDAHKEQLDVLAPRPESRGVAASGSRSRLS
jgi:phage-related minor tail protein